MKVRKISLCDELPYLEDPLFCTALESAGVRGYNLGAATMELPEELLEATVF